MTQTYPAIRRRGRPPRSLDNASVKAFLIVATHPAAPERWRGPVGDILTGATFLQSEGQGSTRPLSRRLLLRILQTCDNITSNEVSRVIARNYSRSQVDRYMASARVASKALSDLLARHPEWRLLASEPAAFTNDEEEDPLLLTCDRFGGPEFVSPL